MVEKLEPPDSPSQAAARAWLHSYGINTSRYLDDDGGDHPAMRTLPQAFEAFAAVLNRRDPNAITLDPEDEALSDKVASAIGATQLLVSGTLFDLLCVSNYANDHAIHRLLKDAAKMAIVAISKERGT